MHVRLFACLLLFYPLAVNSICIVVALSKTLDKICMVPENDSDECKLNKSLITLCT